MEGDQSQPGTDPIRPWTCRLTITLPIMRRSISGRDRGSSTIASTRVALAAPAGDCLVVINVSDGIDYVHGFGQACLIAHDGWHFHMQCGSVGPPVSSTP